MVQWQHIMEKKVYNVKNKINEIYDSCVKNLDSKKVGVLAVILFAVSLIPIIYVGLYNYASGDDYWFSVHTYRAWAETGSFWAALKGSCRMVAQIYQEWQGTWFTIFLFTLSPNNFHEKGYVLTVFIALGLLIGSLAYLANFYLIKKLQFSRGVTVTVTCMILYLLIQYMPRTTSGLFWFNGIMHYSVPLFLGVLAVVHAHKFVEHKKVRDFIIVFVSFTLLGGGSYLIPICASLAVVLILICQLEVGNLSDKNIKVKYDKKNLWLLVALVTETIGLLISFLSPGNSVRGGEEFGFSLKWALECIYYSIDRGIYLGIDYFTGNPVTLVIFVIIGVLLWEQLWKIDYQKYRFKYPLLVVIYMNGIYWASYAPEIYSRSDVSGGCQNTYMQVFFIVTLANMLYVHGWLQRKMKESWRKQAEKTNQSPELLEEKSVLGKYECKKYVVMPIAILMGITFCILTFKEGITTTNEYCIEYISSGKMEQYVDIRKEQHRILSDENIKDAVVPEMKIDYPILHMPLSDDVKMSRNIDRALYYNKNSVKAVMVE